uniref:Putative secreted protein n=1 Tax=Anopheles darlingi TaxID=43151 RepID=A0A2M4DHR5_ANODA
MLMISGVLVVPVAALFFVHLGVIGANDAVAPDDKLSTERGINSIIMQPKLMQFKSPKTKEFEALVHCTYAARVISVPFHFYLILPHLLLA